MKIMKRIRLKIKGTVQGVNFRWFVQSKARELGVVGFVRNCADGSVEAAVEGEEEKLNQLIEQCKKGHASSKVEECIVTEEKFTGEFKKFDIKY